MSHQNRWVKAVRCSDIPPREGRSIRLGEREIAIFNLGNRFLAIDNRCPHKGGPLAEGIVAGTSVVCPLHAWKVDLDTGAVVRPAVEKSCVQAHAVRVIDGVIQVRLPLHTPDRVHDELRSTEQNSSTAWSMSAGAMGELTP